MVTLALNKYPTGSIVKQDYDMSVVAIPLIGTETLTDMQIILEEFGLHANLNLMLPWVMQRFMPAKEIVIIPIHINRDYIFHKVSYGDGGALNIEQCLEFGILKSKPKYLLGSF
jgi:hypothetical protein